MTRKIDSKIVSYSVVKPEDQAKPEAKESAGTAVPASAPAAQPLSQAAPSQASMAPDALTDLSLAVAPAPPAHTEMNEFIARSDVLQGYTYKIDKSPASDHAMYVTINDIVLNPGTPHEQRRPFEVFINSKNMDQFQWVVAMTRIISAVFRKGGDVTFLVEEMKAVFDPHGGYFRPGGYVPSTIAEIGQILEKHLKTIGMMEHSGLDQGQKDLIAKKKAELGLSPAQPDKPSATITPIKQPASAVDEGGSYPPSATMCSKCHQKSTIIMDGCATCLNCGHSKCG